ncbi:hypothetical protein AAFF_G00429890 [Aldrovandia affinis]|uniref:Uncharacterized protein n=1 Tax=Aldrovandia affinis TaxID=143900 RepID=A0AAD7WIQ7_9TELE|nr:hypothetical protein AAFF_G00429890 [Aldrovandia affinis]
MQSGLRCMPESSATVEDVLLAFAEQVGLRRYWAQKVRTGPSPRRGVLVRSPRRRGWRRMQLAVNELIMRGRMSEAPGLNSPVMLRELAEALQQMATGCSPGIDGLPVDFYKRFWECIGSDFH